MRILLAMAALAITLAGCSRTAAPPLAQTVAWEDALSRARSSHVNFAMWAGDEERNRYLRGPVANDLKQEFSIDLNIVPLGDSAELVNKLLNEKAAGKGGGGSVDMIWINGENFRTARQGGVLWGPFAGRLPNLNLYDSKAAERDFGTPVDGLEAPWQRSQFAFAYDTSRVKEAPRSIPTLGDWVRANPGRFTYIAPPDFTGSAFVRHVLLHFADDSLQSFDEGNYARAAAKAVEFLKSIRPFLWRRGETYPSSPRELDRLFANQEVDFAMSYNPAFASVRIDRGEFPPTARSFVFESGTLGNYNYLAIPFNASNVHGAIVVINHLMSFDRALDFSRVLRIPFPLIVDKLSMEQREQVAQLPRGVATLPDEELASHFLPEPDAEYLRRFERDWMEKVLRP